MRCRERGAALSCGQRQPATPWSATLELPVPSPITREELARLGLARFVSLDLETTGLDASSDQIIELGAVRFEGGEEVARFSELVSVDRDLPPFITRLTSITDNDLVGRPAIAELLGPFLEFVGEDPVVGQNISFDLGFLQSALKAQPEGRRPAWTPGPSHDTSTIARAFFPTMPTFALGALARRLGVELVDAHRAAEDAAATGQVLVELLKRARRTPRDELEKMDHLLGGAAFTLGGLVDGLSAIGPGEAGYDEPAPLPDNRIGRWDGIEEGGVEAEEIGEEWFERFFADDGPFSGRVEGYSRREGQVRMAWDVYRTLTEGGSLLCEGGTGTGKSFAYLLPSLLRARMDNERTVVATHTRHLQSQLFDKDLPTLEVALGGGVRAVLLKGRGNYICRRRFDALVAEPSRLDPLERVALLPLVRWLARTRTGDISEVPGFKPWGLRGLWAKISADSGFCSARTCRASQCFLHRIRTSAQHAHVVLVNHALLFSDLSAGGGVIGEYDRLVFDEAHHLESVAAEHLGLSWNRPAERAVLNNLHDPKAKQGLVTRVQRAYGPLLRTQLERGDADNDPFDRAVEATVHAQETGDALDGALEKLVLERDPAGLADSGYTRKVRYRSGEETFAEASEPIARHVRALEMLAKALDGVADELDELEGMPMEGDDVLGEFSRLRREAKGLASTVARLTGEPEENMVYWYDAPRPAGRQPLHLYGAPLDVAAVLREQLYPKLESLVLTSATLTVAESFTYIKGRLGLEEAEGHIYDSPFDIRGQLLIGVADFMGNPNDDPARFGKAMGRLSWRLATELDAGTLSLFTSQRMLSDAWDYASPLLERQGWLVLGQGISGSQHEVLRRFREDRRSVLFGVDSFWEGIDVPGDSLELAILARIPFAVPTDPLVEARSEKVKQEGRNPFMDYALPEAALRLRQGIGRLIRTTSDVGAAVICDARIVRSRWGRLLQKSLPVQPIVYDNYDDLHRDLHRFLRPEQE